MFVNLFNQNVKVIVFLSILLGFMAQNFGYRHEETMLREHGRARTKERQAERGQKSGTVVPCHVARGGRATCGFAASSAWRLGFVRREFLPGV